MSSNTRRNFPFAISIFLEELRDFLQDKEFTRHFDDFKTIKNQLQKVIQHSQETIEKVDSFKDRVFKTTGDSVVTINHDVESKRPARDCSDQRSVDEQPADPSNSKNAVNSLSDLKFRNDYEELIKKQAYISPTDQATCSVTETEPKPDNNQSAINQPAAVHTQTSTSASDLLSTLLSIPIVQSDTDKHPSTPNDSQHSEPSATTPIRLTNGTRETTDPDGLNDLNGSPPDDDQSAPPASETNQQLLENFLNQSLGQIDPLFRARSFDRYNINTGKFDEQTQADESPSDATSSAAANKSAVASKSDVASKKSRESEAANSDGNLVTLEDFFSDHEKDRSKKTFDNQNSEKPSVLSNNPPVASSSNEPAVSKTASRSLSRLASSKTDAVQSDEEKFALDIDFNKIRASKQPTPTESDKFKVLEDDFADMSDLSDGESFCSARSTTRSTTSLHSNASARKRKRNTESKTPQPKTKNLTIELVSLPEKLIELASRNAKMAIKEIAKYEAEVGREARRARKEGFDFKVNKIKIQLPTTSSSQFNFGQNDYDDYDDSDSEDSEIVVKRSRVTGKKRTTIVVSSSEEDNATVRKRPRKDSSSYSSEDYSSLDESDSNISVFSTTRSSNSRTKKQMPKKKKKQKLKVDDYYSPSATESGEDSDVGMNWLENKFLENLNAPVDAADQIKQASVVEGREVVEQTDKENVNASARPTATEKVSNRIPKYSERKTLGKRKKIKRALTEGGMKELGSLGRKQQETLREMARISRIKEIQRKFQVFNGLTDLSGQQSVVLEYESEKGSILVQIHPILAKSFKAHQKDGVRFMYWNTVESLQALSKNDPGNGTILAHNPGLGKTFQVISLVHCLSTNNHTKDYFQRVLVLVPVNVLANWSSEIQKWIYDNDLSLPRHVYNPDTSNRCLNFEQKSKVFNDWYEIGGILLMGHKAFASLIEDRWNDEPPEFDALIQKVFLNPGPSLVVVDEGHEIKNKNNLLNVSLNKIQTKRRIVLSGTPLQNRLEEYYHMCNFVRPYLLGEFTEYKEEFIKLIEAGQHEDSSPYDVKRMKKRIHVLQQWLGHVLHRVNYEVLKKELTVTKYEYVLKLKLTDIQDRLYRKYLTICRASEEDEESKVRGNRFFHHHRNFCNIYNQPLMLFKGKSGEEGWYKEIMEEVRERSLVSLSSKFLLFLLMLQACEKRGEKLIIFSERLETLNFIEELLRKESVTRNDPKNFQRYKGQKKDFQKGTDYLRIDGDTSTCDRLDCVNKFNEPTNTICRLFLLSKEACSHGINLIGANRCIIFETHFNPAKDQQSICRTYRYGQTKDVYVYRFVAHGTAEESIYAKQVQKQSLINRILDDHQSKRAFKYKEIKAFYEYQPEVALNRNLKVPEDDLLAEILRNYPDLIVDFHEHDSLLEIIADHDLTEEEKMQAWDEWERVKKGKEEIQQNAMNKQKESYLSGFGLKTTNLNTANGANVQPTTASQPHPRTRSESNVPTTKNRRTIASSVPSKSGQSIPNFGPSRAHPIEIGSTPISKDPVLLNLLKTPLVSGTSPRSLPKVFTSNQVPKSSANRTPLRSSNVTAGTWSNPLVNQVSPSKLYETQRTYSNAFRPQQTSTNSTPFFIPNSNQPSPFVNFAQGNRQPHLNTSLPNMNHNYNVNAPPTISPQQKNPPLFHPLFQPQQASRPINQPMNQPGMNQPRFAPQSGVRTNTPNTPTRIVFTQAQYATRQTNPNMQPNVGRPANAQPNVNMARPTNVQPNVNAGRPRHAQLNLKAGRPNVTPNANASRPMKPQNIQVINSRVPARMNVPDPKEFEEKAFSSIKTYYKTYEKSCQPTTGIDLIVIFSDRLRNLDIRSKQLDKQQDSASKARELAIIKEERRIINEIMSSTDGRRLSSIIESSMKIIRPDFGRSIVLDVEEMD